MSRNPVSDCPQNRVINTYNCN